MIVKVLCVGLWCGILVFDILFYVKVGEEELKVEVFGVKLKFDFVLDVDLKGGVVLIYKIKYFIISLDFVCINGILYLEEDVMCNLIG